MRTLFTGVAIPGLFVLGLSIQSSAAQAQTSTEPQVWQGEMFITGFANAGAPTACGGDAVIGDYYRVVYRPIIPDSPENGVTHDEGLTFIGSRNALHYFTDPGVSFTKPGKGYLIYLGTHGQSDSQTNPPATLPFHLSIAPEKITLKTKTVSITGTLSNWENATGCDIEISAVLLPRID